MKIRAPAKINLTLRVVGKRADGYHLLDTVMVPVSLYDEIEIHPIRRSASGRSGPAALIAVRCNHPHVPLGRDNIAYRAAELLMRKANIRRPVAIRIRKKIPVGAGLGGGSTDAAAVLVGLNRMWKLRLSVRQLERLALQLGADVPFFIRAKPARARGIGEKLRLLPKLRRRWLVLIYPGFPVATAWVFGNLPLKLTKVSVNTSIATLLESLDKLDSLLINDLEQVTLRRYPEIVRAKSMLSLAGAAGVMMSGSGSSVFGIFESKRLAEKAFRRLRHEEGFQAYLVHVLN
ncbi:MAG TPA: 4-(cytidine 5'-diphospho)-2-C-methyl-D-erythritol kinase [Candidatus Binatia bacterium]